MKKHLGSVTEKDRAMAQKCIECPACRYARKKQRGFVFWFVKAVEQKFCPYCDAYARVYGHYAHEAITG